ncbi:hypothetical protein BU17DRAFT_70859 [Hysterangium stoloniferum]|nr:hypothetical protein BU17DRAFT_70859 [Hysterangium stoloniferum]
MSNIVREAMTRWFAPVIRNPTDVEVGPGYFCGLGMERIGTKLLYGTKLSILVGKCFFNTRDVEEHQRRVVRLTDTVGQLSIIVKEGVDLLRHVRFWLGTSEEANIGRVIVVMGHVIDLMVFIEDSPAKMVPRNFLVTAMLSPRYSYHTPPSTLRQSTVPLGNKLFKFIKNYKALSLEGKSILIMFAWGAVLVWGEIGGTVCKGHTACHQGHAAWANILARRISVRKFPTVPSQNLIYPLCLVETMQGREKVAEKEMQQMQQDKRCPAPCPQTPKPSVPARFEALLRHHQKLAHKENRVSGLSTRFLEIDIVADFEGTGLGLSLGLVWVGWEVGRLGE